MPPDDDYDDLNKINLELKEEIAVIKAIYGEEAVTVKSAGETVVKCVLRIPERRFHFRVDFDSRYPLICPHVVGFGVDDNLHFLTSRKDAGESVKLQNAFADVFMPGEVCLYDTMEAYLRDEGSAAAGQVMPRTVPSNEERQIALLVDVDALQMLDECTICFDEFPAVDLAKLPCKHFMCIDCLNCEYGDFVTATALIMMIF